MQKQIENELEQIGKQADLTTLLVARKLNATIGAALWSRQSLLKRGLKPLPSQK